MRNILIFLPRYHTNINRFCDMLKDNACNVSVVVYDSGFTECRSFDFYRLRPSVLTNIIQRYYRLEQNSLYFIPNFFDLYYLLKNNTDLIIVRDPNRITSIIVSLIAKMLNINTWVYTQSPIHREQKFVRKCMTNIACVIYNKWISPIKGDFTSFNKIHSQAFYTPFPIYDTGTKYKTSVVNKINILCVGKFQKRKNQDILIKAMQVLEASYPGKFKLILIGECTSNSHIDYLDTLKEMVSVSPIDCDFHLNISHKNIISFYKASNIFVLPSVREPFSVSLLEAVENGVISVCTYDNGSKEYISNDQNGYILSEVDVESIVLAIKKCVSLMERLNNTYVKDVCAEFLPAKCYYKLPFTR